MKKKKVYWSIGAVAVLVAVCLNFNHAWGGYGLSGNDFLTKALATPAYWITTDCGTNPSGNKLECGKRTINMHGIYNCRVLSRVYYKKCYDRKPNEFSCKNGDHMYLVMIFSQFDRYNYDQGLHIIGICSADAEHINEKCSTSADFSTHVRDFTNYVPKTYTYNDCEDSGDPASGCLKDPAPSCSDFSFDPV